MQKSIGIFAFIDKIRNFRQKKKLIAFIRDVKIEIIIIF